MCGRYSITTAREKLAEHFKVKMPDTYIIPPKYNAAPSQLLPVIPSFSPDEIHMFKWGLIPSWAKDISIGNKMINARVETVTEKPSFRNAFKKRRCLVLADSYYEWKKTDDGKVPYRIMLKNEEPFAMAGLWEHWKSKEGEEINSFTIITMEASQKVHDIHNRMPAILRDEHLEKWLGDDAVKEDELLPILTPYPDELLKFYPVSKLVNTPVNDTPEIIKEVNLN